MVADLGKALELERKISTRGAKMPLKDALSRVIADYNKLVTLKRHRVDSTRRAMCYNLFLIAIRSLRTFFKILNSFSTKKSDVGVSMVGSTCAGCAVQRRHCHCFITTTIATSTKFQAWVVES